MASEDLVPLDLSKRHVFNLVLMAFPGRRSDGLMRALLEATERGPTATIGRAVRREISRRRRHRVMGAREGRK